MNNNIRVLVSIRDKRGVYSNILSYDTLDSAKRDFDSQISKFPVEYQDDFTLEYFGFFDLSRGLMFLPLHDFDDNSYLSVKSAYDESNLSEKFEYKQSPVIKDGNEYFLSDINFNFNKGENYTFKIGEGEGEGVLSDSLLIKKGGDFDDN